jgi:hypothetical protein
MNVFRITLTDHNRNGQRLWVNFECSAVDVAELMQRLDEDKVLYGMQLFTQLDPNADRTLEVTDAKEIILGRDAIYKIEVPDRWRFVRYAEA